MENFSLFMGRQRGITAGFHIFAFPWLAGDISRFTRQPFRFSGLVWFFGLPFGVVIVGVGITVGLIFINVVIPVT